MESPRGQGGVEVVEERVVDERIHRGGVTSQGLDSLPVEVDAWPAELPVGVEAVDEAAEVTDQRFEAGTAFLDPFLQRLVPSRPHESATPSTRACSEAQKASGSVDGHLAPLATAWLTGGLPDDGCSA